MGARPSRSCGSAERFPNAPVRVRVRPGRGGEAGVRRLGLAAAAVLLCGSTGSAQDERARLRSEAARVTITRDDWGVAHVRGRTDVDAVFGMIYAQAEDDFGRVEANYIGALGRTAEVEGEGALWADLRTRLFTDPETLRARYASPMVDRNSAPFTSNQ